MTPPVRPADGSLSDAIRQLRDRLAEVERERDRLLELAALHEDLAASLHFTDILQAVAGRVGRAFALDRCSVFLVGEQGALRLVASYEDPSLRNLAVDPQRYPELQRSLESGDTVFIPDATAEPLLRPVWAKLVERKVQSILVVPIKWDGRPIGLLFLRTARGKPPLDEGDVAFCQRVAAATASALHHAHRLEGHTAADPGAPARDADVRRQALLAYVQKLLARTGHDGAFGGETLSRTTGEELDRLVDVAVRVLQRPADRPVA
ncbi:MAG: GAF domain-containing protein [Gemmatimonadota bacterium]